MHQVARPLAFGKYYSLDIENKVQEIQEDALWTDFVYEKENKDVEPEKVGAEQNKGVASRVEEGKERASVSAQVQDLLEEVNLGEDSVQQPTLISASLRPVTRTSYWLA